MTFAEARKAVIAVLGGITSIIPQVLASFGGIIPTEVASWLTIIAAVATAVLVYLVPNAPADPLAKVRTSIDALGPVFDVIRQNVRDEVAARLPRQQSVAPSVQAGMSPIGLDSSPVPSDDPFAVPQMRLGRRSLR
jgi:hypothetical protein